MGVYKYVQLEVSLTHADGGQCSHVKHIA
jgi:hypothetical protein